jgi:hypothetical protein
MAPPRPPGQCVRRTARTLASRAQRQVDGSPNYSEFPLGRAFNVSIRPFNYPELLVTPEATKQVAENRFETDPGNFIIGETTVCAEDAQGLRYPSATKRSGKRARTTAKVACPDGRDVLSGGALAGGPFRSQRLVSTAPFDSDDPGSKPDDGWRVSVDNLQSIRRKIKAYAICTSSQDLSYVSDGFTATNGSRSHIEPTCPGGEFAIGGGVRHDIGYRKATLVASRVPSPFPGSKWVVELDNLSEASAQGRTFAICHA